MSWPVLLGQAHLHREVAVAAVFVEVARRLAADRSLSPGDINATVQAAVGGQAAGDLNENGSDRHFPMKVRLAEKYRHDMAALERIAIGVQTDKGGVIQVPLSEVAKVGLSAAPSTSTVSNNSVSSRSSSRCAAATSAAR